MTVIKGKCREFILKNFFEEIKINIAEIADHDLQEMLLLVDREGRIIYGNKTAGAQLGYDQELSGLAAAAVFVAENEAENLWPAGGGRQLVKMTAYRQNNTCFPVFLRLCPLPEPAGVSLITAVDISNQQTLERELSALRAEAAQMLGIRNEFIANVTHELRTPVNGIKGHVSALLPEITAAGHRQTLEIIRRCCNDMSSIINNILDFSKLEAGKFELSMTRFDLYELLNHVMATNIAVINEKGLLSKLNIAADVPRFVYGDDLRLTQILNNLISNAVKFTDVGYVKVDVSMQMQAGEAIELFFMVRDSGIGIAAEDKDRLFKSFSQVDGSRTRKYGGTGLGLVITKDLIGLMGGTIQVESRKDKGSSFSFFIRLRTVFPESEGTVIGENEMTAPAEAEKKLTLKAPEEGEDESCYQYGSPDNQAEIAKKISLLILALDLEVWEKAEAIATGLKKLLREAPEELKKMLFRLEMAIRREDGPKSQEYFEQLNRLIDAN